jgi:hypothetical protein
MADWKNDSSGNKKKKKKMMIITSFYSFLKYILHKSNRKNAAPVFLLLVLIGSEKSTPLTL